MFFLVAVILLVIVAAPIALYFSVATGRLTPRLGIGRAVQPLGPITVRIPAPREWVFEAIRAPYSERPPLQFREKVRVLRREGNSVLAQHRTPVRRRLVAVTVEWVTFEPPDRIGFELVRGPVPHVVEEFLLRGSGDTTELEYRGELGADLWTIGRWWGGLVARRWEAAVRASLEQLTRAAELRAGLREKRGRAQD